MPDRRNYYYLDEDSRREFDRTSRRVASMPLVRYRTPEGLTAPDRLYAEIRGHAGGGEYEAVQVERNGAAWDVTTGGVTWGAGATGPSPGYLVEINGVEDVDDYTVVEALSWGDVDGTSVWLFDAGSASETGHPWMARREAGSNSVVEVAWLYPRHHDAVYVYDHVLGELVEIPAASAGVSGSPYTVDVAGIGTDAIVYVAVDWNSSDGWVIRDESTAPLKAVAEASFPPDEETSRNNVFYFPVARAADQGTDAFRVSELAFENPAYWPRQFVKPFRGRVYDDSALDKVEIGFLRDSADYPLADGFVVRDNDGDQQFVADAASSVSNSLPGSAGYVWYQLAKDDSTGNWKKMDNSGTPLFAGASFPPATQDYSVVYVLVGRYSGAGTSDFKWHQVLVDNPVVSPRATRIDFQARYTDDAGTPSVEIMAGRVHLQNASATTSTASFDLATDRFVWVEVTSDPDTTPSVNSTLQTAAAFPGHSSESSGTLTTRYLLGFIASGIYYRVHEGAIADGTLWQPDVDPDIEFGDPQGVQLLGRESWTGVSGAGESNSSFFTGREWDVHYRAGEMDNEDTGSEIAWGGTDDDITSETFVTDLRGSTGAISFCTRDLTHELTAGLSTKNELTDESCGGSVPFTEVEVVTDVRVSGTEFQKKTRSIYVLSAGAESAWTVWHTGSTCP